MPSKRNRFMENLPAILIALSILIPLYFMGEYHFNRRNMIPEKTYCFVTYEKEGGKDYLWVSCKNLIDCINELEKTDHEILKIEIIKTGGKKWQKILKD